MIVCPKCGNQIFSPETTRFCAMCNYPFPDAHGLPEPSAAPGIAWESAESLGIFKALVMTLRACLMAPKVFFARLADSRNSFMAWIYALVLGSIGTIFSFVWIAVFATQVIPLLGNISPLNVVTVAGLICLPLLVSLRIVLTALYFHFLLYLTRSKAQKFGATFRIICYVQSTAIFSVIPGIGGIVSAFWSLYILAVGFSRVHRISAFRAVMIILLPILLLLLILSAVVLMLGAGLAITRLKGLLPLFQ